MTFERSFYTDRAESIDKELSGLNSLSLRISFVRLAVFLVDVFLIILSCSSHDFLRYFCAVIAVIVSCAFIFVCIKHNQIKTKLKHLNHLKHINLQYIDRIDGVFESLSDGGDEFFISNHDYCNDLDLFGKKSLFALYNISISDYGRRAFANELLYAPSMPRSIAEINERQSAAEQFAGNPVFLQEYQATALGYKVKKSPADIINTTGKHIPDKRFCLLGLAWIIPLICLFVAPIVARFVACGIIVINLLVWFSNLALYNEMFNGMTSAMRSVPVLIRLFSMLETFDSESGMIKIFANKKYSSALTKLKQISNLAALRSQPITDLLINMCFPLNVLLCNQIQDWSKDNKEVIDEGMLKLAEIETVMSISMVEIISKNTVIPSFAEDSACFVGKDIYHPLIKPDEVVANSIELKDNIAVITGSNMSGKTTLIRTVGTLSLLAYIGAKVPASDLTLSKMRIMSSMRIADNLDEGISTFKAELNKIASIIQVRRNMKADERLLFLIDEIFRGTNSLDRTEGALIVLRNLSDKNICGLMTTHDYAMCDQAKENMSNIEFYHFAERYVDNGIVFDYKLQFGVSYISNARYLMKLVGIE